MKHLVSVIVPTRNSSKFLASCLESITRQTYQNIELLVIDNNSTDETKDIAAKFTTHVYNCGPERSAQRNFGAKKAKGEYLLFIDSDMVLTPDVVKVCVEKAEKDKKIGGIIIPEESFGKGFWARAKALERSFYLNNEFIEAARFFNRDIFEKLGGFDESLTGPEDWDLSQRVKSTSKLARIDKFIRHNEGALSLIDTVRKKYYYSKKFSVYLSKRGNGTYTDKQFSPVGRYLLFFRQPSKLFKSPLLGVGMLFMKTCEFAAGGAGFVMSRSDKRNPK